MALTTTAHSPQQLMVVWHLHLHLHLHLHADAEGPTSSPQQHGDCSTSVFYIRTSQSPSGHTNALAESFFATLKNELFDTQPWPHRAAAHTAIFEWIESWYNLHRLLSSRGYRSPVDYEATLAT